MKKKNNIRMSRQEGARMPRQRRATVKERRMMRR